MKQFKNNKMWKIGLLLFLQISNTIGCNSGCPKYHFKPHSNRAEFLSLLPNERNMTNVALVGTHYSAIKNYQNLNISDQLKYGVRVFDIGVRATSNKFAIHNRYHFANLMFGHILNILNQFLFQNPKEFLIVLLREVHVPAWDVTKNNCKILKDYMMPNMLKNWTLNSKIEQYRGKILLATIRDKSFNKCIVNLRSRCRISSEYSIDRHYDDIARKSIEFVRLQDASFYENFQCFINVVSMVHEKERVIKAIALEGSGIKYCSIPMNIRVANTFENPHRALIIVLADFVTQEMIDQINDSNNHNYSLNFWDPEVQYKPKQDITNFLLKNY